MKYVNKLKWEWVSICWLCPYSPSSLTKSCMCRLREWIEAPPLSYCCLLTVTVARRPPTVSFSYTSSCTCGPKCCCRKWATDEPPIPAPITAAKRKARGKFLRWQNAYFSNHFSHSPEDKRTAQHVPWKQFFKSRECFPAVQCFPQLFCRKKTLLWTSSSQENSADLPQEALTSSSPHGSISHMGIYNNFNLGFPSNPFMANLTFRILNSEFLQLQASPNLRPICICPQTCQSDQ